MAEALFLFCHLRRYRRSVENRFLEIFFVGRNMLQPLRKENAFRGEVRMKMTGAEILMECLVREGVDTSFRITRAEAIMPSA